MQFTQTTAPAKVEGFIESAAFKIESSGKAYKGLIDAIYSRPIEAVIRELATNAFDSHKSANSLKPFDLVLPSKLNPIFIIRDYGISMTHEMVMNRYSKLFDSTKDGLKAGDDVDNANQQVGMLGLGSKSFFSYTDTCNLTAYLDGELRYYSIYLGENDTPYVSLVFSAKTQEPNGIEVSISVKSKDVEAFRKSAIRVLKGFPILPNKLPQEVVDALSEKPIRKSSFWRTYSKNYLKETFWAKQGCVLYPIALGEIDDRATRTEPVENEDGAVLSASDYKLSEKFEKFENMNGTMVIDFPIGSLDFDLGRERLQYNDKTVATLKARWQEMVDDLGNEFDKHFVDCKTDWEIYQKVSSMDTSDVNMFFETSEPHRVASKVKSHLSDILPLNRSKKIALKKYVHSTIKIRDKDHLEYDVAYACTDYGFNGGSSEFPADFHNSIIVLRDRKVSRLNLRVKQYLIDNDIKYAMVIDNHMVDEDLLDKLGKPPLVNSIELPMPAKDSKVVNARHWGTGGGEFHRIKIIGTHRNLMQANSAEDYKGHYFCFLNCGEPWYPHPVEHELSLYQLASLNKNLKTLRGKGVSFINIKKNEMDKLSQWEKYPMIYDYYDTMYDKLPKKTLVKIAKELNHRTVSNSIYGSFAIRWQLMFPKDRGQFWALEKHSNRSVCYPDISKAINSLDADSLSSIKQQIRDKGIYLVCDQLSDDDKISEDLLDSKHQKLANTLLYVHVLKDESHQAREKLIYQAVKEKIGC